MPYGTCMGHPVWQENSDILIFRLQIQGFQHHFPSNFVAKMPNTGVYKVQDLLEGVAINLLQHVAQRAWTKQLTFTFCQGKKRCSLCAALGLLFVHSRITACFRITGCFRITFLFLGLLFLVESTCVCSRITVCTL